MSFGRLQRLSVQCTCMSSSEYENICLCLSRSYSLYVNVLFFFVRSRDPIYSLNYLVYLCMYAHCASTSEFDIIVPFRLFSWRCSILFCSCCVLHPAPISSQLLSIFLLFFIIISLPVPNKAETFSLRAIIV